MHSMQTISKVKHIWQTAFWEVVCPCAKSVNCAQKYEGEMCQKIQALNHGAIFLPHMHILNVIGALHHDDDDDDRGGNYPGA